MATVALIAAMVLALIPVLGELIHHLPEIARARSESRVQEWLGSGTTGAMSEMSERGGRRAVG